MATSADDCAVVSLPPPRRGKKRPWAPTDLENNPKRESELMEKIHICMDKLENSEFARSFFYQMQTPHVNDKFLKVLGSEHKMQMVIYGIGRIESSEASRVQLSTAILMKKKFDWIGDIEVFDPVLSLTESNVIESLGWSVLSVNEHCRREVVKPTMFFMPHCGAELYDNLLEANWAVDRLTRFLVLGNSFSTYAERVSNCADGLSLSRKTKRVLSARRFTHELEVRDVGPFGCDYFFSFCFMSWHFFSPADDAELNREETF